jgi:hypothetical protein
MAKLITVDGDKVEGTDKHNISGTGLDSVTSNPSMPYTGIADFDYKGAMTDQLSDFVGIGGKAAALVTSQSSLDPGEDSAGGHAATSAKSVTVIAPTTVTSSVVTAITDPIGTGKPSAGMGSTFVKAGGNALLLDGDSIDTCDGLSIPMNSTVTASEQDFVSCSE